MPKKLEIKLRREARKLGYKGKKLNEFVRDNLYPSVESTIKPAEKIVKKIVEKIVKKKRGRPKK